MNTSWQWQSIGAGNESEQKQQSWKIHGWKVQGWKSLKIVGCHLWTFPNWKMPQWQYDNGSHNNFKSKPSSMKFANSILGRSMHPNVGCPVVASSRTLAMAKFSCTILLWSNTTSTVESAYWYYCYVVSSIERGFHLYLFRFDFPFNYIAK